MSPSPNKQAWLVCVPMLMASAAVAIVGWFWWQPREQPPAREFPLPPLTKSRYLNTGPEAQYIGIAACAECHDREHKSFLHTAHSEAFTDLDLKAEPADATYYHKLSGRTYQVYRKDGKFYHKEFVGKDKANPLLTLDLPVRYLVGSGHVTRSYVVEVEGFLHESPVTWYTERKEWDMSPGYNHPGHSSFERPIDTGCLRCHTGRVEPDKDAHNRLLIGEQRIGCESCHGPGSLHRDWHKAKKPLDGPDDLTIVRPDKLPRALGEAICAQCHLRGDATIFLRGRQASDFRPGLPLSDFRIDYHWDVPPQTMKVVGHVEQMRQSKCYKESKTLTCLTCHDLHAKSKPKDAVANYKQTCLNCHTTESCGVELKERLKESAQDNCLACHMSSGKTDIPHIAFTHHKIGIHKSQAETPQNFFPELVPFEANAQLSALDLKRNLGLAYVEASYKQRNPTAMLNYQRWGLDRLLSVHKQGLEDGETEEALARLYFDQEPAQAAKFAKLALTRKNLPSNFRVNAMYIAAHFEYQSGRPDAALAILNDLTKLRRHSEDWLLLGLCHRKQNQLPLAAKALQTSLSINPFRPDVHDTLALVYNQMGESKKAREHEAAAKMLAQGP